MDPTFAVTPDLRAKRALFPGGYGRSALAVDSTSPIAIRGEGCRLLTDSGAELIDLNNNFTTLIHGNAHPAVVEAAARAISDGASFGLPNLGELRHADALMSRLPGLDQVRYANSGTEAVMAALRVARAHTGRDGCLFVDATYHGSADAALVPGGAKATRGVPRKVREDVAVTPINDVEALVEAVSSEPNRFGALIVDVMPNRAGLLSLEPEFLAAAANLRDRYGLLLIVDEVISFRQAWGGAAAAAGLEPDMITLGKLIGGGHPIGALVGTREVMSELDTARPDGLLHGGTFSGNPVTMEAGRVALELLDEAAIAKLNELGERARRKLGERIANLGWEVRGDGSLFRLFPVSPPASPAGPPASVLARQGQLWQAAHEHGVLIQPTALAALSTPMTSEVIDDAVERLCAAVESLPAENP